MSRIVKLENPVVAERLFEGWNETVIWSALQSVMGEIYADDEENPTCAMVYLCDFAFFAGRPDEELAGFKPDSCRRDFVIMVPQNAEWEQMLEKCHKDKIKKVTRYAIKKEGFVFDKEKLKAATAGLPAKYEMKLIDEDVFYKCREESWSEAWTASFGDDYALFKERALGVVISEGEKLVAGASSYSVYNGGIEIEISTEPEYRRQGLAYAAASRLILECMERGLYPSWDAQNKFSVGLAEKLGYHFSHEYTAYENFKWRNLNSTLSEHAIPILEFDADRTAVIMAESFTKRILPDKAVMLFMKEDADEYVRKNKCELLCRFDSFPVDYEVYGTVHKGERIAIVKAPLGGPAAALLVEKLTAGGVKKIIATGCCGALVEDTEGDFFLPVAACRQEGTSYQYLPASKEVELDEAGICAIEKALEAAGLSGRRCRVWTTDALFRETKELVKARRSQGYSVVDMECASMAACARFKGIGFAQLLFTADTLADENRHDVRNEAVGVFGKALLLALDAAVEYR